MARRALVDGANVLAATIFNGRGDVLAELKREVAYANTPARAVLVPEASHLAADGPLTKRRSCQ